MLLFKNIFHMKKNRPIPAIAGFPEKLPTLAVPKTTTELPFFYLTKQKYQQGIDITYQGTDYAGRPMRWVVTPNRSPTIGVPGIDAHQVWVRLVLSRIDAQRTMEGGLLKILPLGRVRECLRAVGWTEGGWEARRLLQALSQIGAAWCDVDLWLPTRQIDQAGSTLYRRVNGKFNRLSLYAIGEKHLTEEDLLTGQFNFDFELEDVIYLELHSLEVEMQRDQPQRLIDAEYLFTVGPAARRWYELLAPKIFGVVKNRGVFCEVSYSWYVKHHHTLKRYYDRYRVVFQMNRIVKDHLDAGYITKVEYRAVQEPGQERDFVIRYYPGQGAHESIQRIAAFRTAGRRKAAATLRLVHPIATDNNLGSGLGIGDKSKQEPPVEQGVDPALITELTKRGIVEDRARGLVQNLAPDQHIVDQLEWGDAVIARDPGKILNPAGFYVSLIKDNIIPPEMFESSRKRRLREEATQARERQQQNRARLELAYEDYKKQQLDDFIKVQYTDQETYWSLLGAKKAELQKRYTWVSRMKEEALLSLAENGVRAEIARQLTLIPFETFCQQEQGKVPASTEPTELLAAPQTSK